MSIIKEKKMEIPTGDGLMDAFMAAPEHPLADDHVRAVIVVQEAFGVNPHIEEICRRIAREGYVAVAPEFFHREGRGLRFGYEDIQKVMPIFQKLSNKNIADDLEATLGVLEKYHGIPSANVAVIGFCMGGLAAMLAACKFSIATAIAYYGGGMVEKRPGLALSPILEDFEDIDCPVLLFFGDQDQGIPANQVHAVESELKAQQKKFKLIVYPGAGHGFSNDERPSYHESSARAAWKETLAWLKRVGE